MGARMRRDRLNREGFDVGRTHVGRLMKRMGMAARSRKPGTSTKHPGHDVYPYLLRRLTINRANQVWAARHDLHSQGQRVCVPDRRHGLGQPHGLSLNSRDHVGGLPCGRGVARGVHTAWHTRDCEYRPGRPLTAQAFVYAVKDRGCHLSMDGRGAWRDHVFIERLWKSVKYERVYLHAYDSVTEARPSILQYVDWYNRARPHSSLDRHTPDEAYAVMLPTGKRAA